MMPSEALRVVGPDRLTEEALDLGQVADRDCALVRQDEGGHGRALHDRREIAGADRLPVAFEERHDLGFVHHSRFDKNSRTA
jgi:hypothetical protein